MVGVREEVPRLQGFQLVSGLGEGTQVACARRRVAGHQDDARGTRGRDRLAHLRARSGARRVGHDNVRYGTQLARQVDDALTINVSGERVHPVEGCEILARVTHGTLVTLERHDAPRLAGGSRDRNGKEARARVQLHDRAPSPGLARAKRRSQHRVREHLGAAHVRLPETGGSHVVGLVQATNGNVPTHHVGIDTRAIRGVGLLADQDDGCSTRGGHRAHAVPRLPQATPRRRLIEEAKLTNRWHCQGHVLERDHAAASELVHAGTPLSVDDDVDARAATGQRITRVLIPQRRSDTHSPESVHGLGQGLAAHAAQLPGDDAGLPVALSGRRQMRELATTDASRTCLGPDGLDAVGRGLNDLDGIRPGQLLLDGTHARADDLSGCRVAHEDDTTAGVAGHAGTAVRGLPDGQFENLADALARARGLGTTALGGTTAGRAGAHTMSSSVVSPGDSAGAAGRVSDSGEAGEPTRRNGSLTR